MSHLNSNRKEVRNKVKQHILDCVYDDNGNEYERFKKAAGHLAADFKRVANYDNNVRRIPNQQERFKDYMQGVPFYFEHMYYEQRKLVAEWLQSTDPDKYTDQEVADRYYYMIYKEIKNFIK